MKNKFISALLFVLLFGSCRRSETENLSVAFRNLSMLHVDETRIFCGSGEKGIIIRNVVPNGLATWHPLGVDIDGCIGVEVWLESGETHKAVIKLSHDDELTIIESNHLVISFNVGEILVEVSDDLVKMTPIGAMEIMED